MQLADENSLASPLIISLVSCKLHAPQWFIAVLEYNRVEYAWQYYPCILNCVTTSSYPALIFSPGFQPYRTGNESWSTCSSAGKAMCMSIYTNSTSISVYVCIKSIVFHTLQLQQFSHKFTKLLPKPFTFWPSIHYDVSGRWLLSVPYHWGSDRLRPCQETLACEEGNWWIYEGSKASGIVLCCP